MLEAAITLIGSAIGITISAFLMKRILSEYDDFKKEVRNDFRRLETKVTNQSLSSAQTHISTNEKIAGLETSFAKFGARTELELAKTNSFIVQNDKAMQEIAKTHKKLVEILKAIYSRILMGEKEIKTIKERLDDNHIFVKTKKD